MACNIGACVRLYCGYISPRKGLEGMRDDLHVIQCSQQEDALNSHALITKLTAWCVNEGVCYQALRKRRR